jgi:16S rRNA (guanine1207-N2)-methyltransferase
MHDGKGIALARPYERWHFAQEAGAVDAPQEGAIAVWGADGPTPFDPARVVAVQGVFPAYQACLAAGLNVGPAAPDGPLAMAYVHADKSRARTGAYLRAAYERLAPGGLLVLDGDKTQGVEALYKALRKQGLGVQNLAKAHGRLVWAVKSAPVDWPAAPQQSPAGFQTSPGVFSAEKLDAGSALLLVHLPALGGVVADYGGGWGALSAQILRSDQVTHLDLIEADYDACQDAKANLPDPRAHIHWGDALAWAGRPYDAIVTNPPFHTGRAGQPELGQAFLKAAARQLKGKGQLWLVANRHLPYEAVLETCFATVTPVVVAQGYKVMTATGPRTRGK